MKTKVKKQPGDEYGEVHIKQYKRALDRIELLEGKVKGLNARLSTLLTVFGKVDAKTDAVGEEWILSDITVANTPSTNFFLSEFN